MSSIPYRWNAQDAAAAGATPPRLVSPYGYVPTELTLPAADPSRRRPATAFEDGEPLDLPRNLCRVPSLVSQFTVKDHRWEAVPPGIVATTIGELCAALFKSEKEPIKYGIYADFAKTAADFKTAEAKRTSEERRRGIAKKLFEYWVHADLRWAVLHGGLSLTDLDQHPETIPLSAKATATIGGKQVEISGKITSVLARFVVSDPIAVAPNKAEGSASKAPSNGADAGGVKSSPGKLPKPVKAAVRAPYLDLDADLLETVSRSFYDRVAALPETQWNLMYGFGGNPKTPWDALDTLGPMGVNFLVRIFDRTRDIDPTKQLWRQIKYIRNQWWGGSAGMKVVYYKPADIRSVLDGLIGNGKTHSVARDTYLGAMEHQTKPMKDLVAELALDSTKASGDPPDCDPWREVYKLGEEGMHYCVGKQDIKRVTSLNPLDYGPRPVGADDIHIDWISPVSGVDPSTGRCQYSISVSWEHWWQATHGKGAPIFTFAAIADNLGSAHDLAEKLGDPVKIAEVADFTKRWNAKAMGLAVKGKLGYDQSMDDYRELVALLMKLQKQYAAYGSEKELMRALSEKSRSTAPSPDVR